MDTNTKQQVMDAFKQGMSAGYGNTKSKNLRWWERALWVLLSGLAAAACAYLTGCVASYSQGADGAIHSTVVMLPVEWNK